MHKIPQFLPSQLAVPCGTTEHGVQLAPQVRALVLLTQSPPQRWKPLLHWIPQLVPSHVALPFGGTGHGEQLEPQLAGSAFSRHFAPHEWYPGLHRNPQTLPAHVAAPKVTSGQAFVQEPQWFGSVVSSTQVESQRVDVVPVQPLVQAYAPLATEQNGVGSAQLVAQCPQCAGVVMSVSQPSSAFVEQCARPVRHAAVTSHAPATQCALAAVTPGSVVQS